MRAEKQPATSSGSFVDNEGLYNERPAPSVVLRHSVRALPTHLVSERLQRRRPRVDAVHDNALDAQRALQNTQIYELEGSPVPAQSPVSNVKDAEAGTALPDAEHPSTGSVTREKDNDGAYNQNASLIFSNFLKMTVAAILSCRHPRKQLSIPVVLDLA